MRTQKAHTTVSRSAFVILVALPFLPLCGFLLNGPPAMVFFMGAICFILGVMLLVLVVAVSNMPPAVSPPTAKRFHFTIRDLLCLTMFVFGSTMFIVSAFRCEAAERANRPDPLPAVAFRQFVWEQESGLICITIGSLMWIRSGLERAPKK